MRCVNLESLGNACVLVVEVKNVPSTIERVSR